MDTPTSTHQLLHQIAVPAKPSIAEQITTKKTPRYNPSRPRVSRHRRRSNVRIVNIPNPNIRTFHVDLTIDSIHRELVDEKITEVQELVAKVDDETKRMDADIAARAVNILLGNPSDKEHPIAGEAILRRLEYLFQFLDVRPQHASSSSDTAESEDNIPDTGISVDDDTIEDSLEVR